MGSIKNAANTLLNVQTGSIPNVGGAMRDWFQPMVFTRVTKSTVAFQLVETAENISFRGVIQPLTSRDLIQKPEGQRAWTWLWLHADPSLTLNVDEIVTYNGVATRIMARKNYTIYGYVEYQLVQDWTGSSPLPVLPTEIDGGSSFTALYNYEINGGDVSTTGTPLDGGSAFD